MHQRRKYSGKFIRLRPISTRVVYRGSGVGRLEETKLRFPNGSTRTYSYIVKPPFVIVAAIRNDKIALVSQHRFPYHRRVWELVKGGINTNERPAAAARRELIEETGYHAKQLKKIGEFMVSPGYYNQTGHVYRASGLTPGVPVPESGGERVEVRWVNLSVLPTMIRRKEIYDSTSIAAISLLNL